MSVLDDFMRVIKDMPRDPIRPENRRIAKLFPSAFVVRGSVFRLAPQPDIVGHDKPLIVMNQDDVHDLRLMWAGMPMPPIDVDQEIADCCEQLFADGAAQR